MIPATGLELDAAVTAQCKFSKTLKWHHDLIFPSWFFMDISRIPWKNTNAVYRFQIPVLVPEIFRFEKCVKYANEMADLGQVAAQTIETW